ncbi:MAG: carboxypeptidase-like regulatory domain-containing protein [Flavobacteriales bacterium]|nr:carboxypeptidase regulatory-like domain-containing protein [Flavobacteriales bacterium]
MLLRIPSIILLLCLGFSAHAVQLRVHGNVTDLDTRAPLAGVTVKVYKDGERLHPRVTDITGRYNILLENGAHYVIRFCMPGRVTKCFSVDTHGAEWEGDGKTASLEVEMTLFEAIDGIDLSYFDMPMGMARFYPLTGQLGWNKDYEARIRPEVQRLMAEVATRRANRATMARNGASAPLHQ